MEGIRHSSAEFFRAEKIKEKNSGGGRIVVFFNVLYI